METICPTVPQYFTKPTEIIFNWSESEDVSKHLV